MAIFGTAIVLGLEKILHSSCLGFIYFNFLGEPQGEHKCKEVLSKPQKTGSVHLTGAHTETFK